jgi:hypothetical protein
MEKCEDVKKIEAAILELDKEIKVASNLASLSFVLVEKLDPKESLGTKKENDPNELPPIGEGVINKLNNLMCDLKYINEFHRKNLDHFAELI